MTDRYFSQKTIKGPRIVITDSEAHHLAHVMRASCGDMLTLFDGSGAEFLAEVARVGRKEVELAILERVEADRELPVRIALAVSLPKGDRQKWLVEKAVELGVAAIVPLITKRSVARPSATSLTRLRRTVIEASKQCGRNRLMEIAEPKAWNDFVQETADTPYRFVAHPGEGVSHLPTPNVLGQETSPKQNILAAIGPEGGFDDDEIGLATAAGWHTIGLGRRILRIETAAILLAGMISAPFISENIG